MRNSHPDPRPTRPHSRALPPGWLVAAVALASILLASCTDDLAAKCPPLAHPPVLTVAAADDPCAARKGESAALLALRVVKTYQRSSPPVAGAPTRYPLRCGGVPAGGDRRELLSDVLSLGAWFGLRGDDLNSNFECRRGDSNPGPSA